ncbi:MAG: Flp pilus assembly complex ATPase component TadA [Planctomycetes bacterium]|nr:Flp pilus assembly complex ATPase component TadA [Planctomycetota bacterium]
MLLGQILMRDGAVTEAQIEEALKRRQPGERLGQALVRLGHARQEAVLRALSEQTHIPTVDLADLEVDADVLSQVAVKIVFRHKVLPIARANGTLRVALSDPLDLDVLDELRLVTRLEIEPVLGPPDEIERLIKKYYGVGADEVGRMVDAQRAEIQILEKEAGREALEMAEDAGLVKFVNQVFTEAVRDRASDIHIEPMGDRLRIRTRIDGVLHEVPAPKEVARFTGAIISRIKIMSNLDIAERRVPQDGRIMMKILGREIDVRVSIIPNICGEGVCLRLLDRQNIRRTLEDLGMPPRVLEPFRGLIAEPHGIQLVTGPTGSGKTTTLYAALQKINSLEDKIITVEDPVEYQLPGVKQIQVNPKVGLTFAGGLRAILRHDPDIIMIGEIRDLETAEIAVQSALTGHLVFSTLHTNDAPSAVTRLIDMGLEPFLVGSTVDGIMAQRLVRCICRACKVEVSAGQYAAGVLPPDIKTVSRGRGCDECRGTGYHGRQGVFELVVLDDELREMILRRESAGRLKRVCVERKGMKTLREDGWDRVRRGITTPEEVLRITKEDKGGQ